MSNTSGFPVKSAYPGSKGIYIEFFTPEDAMGFYLKGLANGSDCFELQSNVVIMKSREAPTGVDASRPN